MNSLVRLLFTILFITSVYCNSIVLTDSNFDELTANGKWILEFYAPWCPHCQKLEPILREAASQVQQEGLDLNIGTIDCTAQSGLSSRFSIRGYPTLKYYTQGKATDYTLGRELADFKKFAQKVKQTASKELKVSSEVNSFLKAQTVSFILATTDKEIVKTVTQVADIFRVHNAAFGHTANMKLCTLISGSPCTETTLFLVNDDPLVKSTPYKGPWSAESLEKFIGDHIYPILGEITFDNWSLITNNGKMTVLALVDPQGPVIHEEFEQLMRVVASHLQLKFTSAWLDAAKFKRFLSQFGSEDVPSFLVIDAPSDIHYINTSVPHTQEAILAFLNDIYDGKVPALGAGSGVWGKMKMMFTSFAWAVNDHPYFFIGLTVFIILFIAIICLIDSTTLPEDSLEKDKEGEKEGDKEGDKPHNSDNKPKKE